MKKKKLEENQLKDIILNLKDKEIHGINVTVPFKQKIIPYLDQLSPEAEYTKSVNTIYLENNKIFGHNTDIVGFEHSINNLKFDMFGKKIFVLGSGGVVPSIIFALNKMKTGQITISNRTKNKAENLQKLFKNINIVDWGFVPDFDVIINATSLGLKINDEINLDLSNIGRGKLFYDVIYNPKETNFLKLGKKLGNLTSNGKLMFVYQALSAFLIWHQVRPEINNEVIELLEI